MSLILLQQLIIVVHLINVQVAVLAEEDAAFTVVMHMVCQPTLHIADIYRTEWTLLLFDALSASAKVPLSILVSELFTAIVRAGKLAHIKNVCDLAGNFHLLEPLLTKRTDTVSC